MTGAFADCSGRMVEEPSPGLTGKLGRRRTCARRGRTADGGKSSPRRFACGCRTATVLGGSVRHVSGKAGPGRAASLSSSRPTKTGNVEDAPLLLADRQPAGCGLGRPVGCRSAERKGGRVDKVAHPRELHGGGAWVRPAFRRRSEGHRCAGQRPTRYRPMKWCAPWAHRSPSGTQSQARH